MKKAMVTAPRGLWRDWLGWMAFVVIVVVVAVNFISFMTLDSTLSCQTSYNRSMDHVLTVLHDLNNTALRQQVTLTRILGEYPPASSQVKTARATYQSEQVQALAARESHPLPQYGC